MSTKRKST